MSIEVRNVSKKFGDKTVLNNVSFTAGTGELVALLGPSGSGKTTLLRVIAGLESSDLGSVWFHGEDVGDSGVRERKVGFVFQHYALFRHMTVFENVAFGLRVMDKKIRPSKADIGRRVGELLELVQLGSFSGRLPGHLSGGQRQRVALARALAVEPKLLLLDEPFGALDAKVRRELRQWLRRLHDDLHITSVFVTHDQDEALELADRVVVMDHGKVEQIGTPDQVYHCPATPFVFEFLGNVNLFHGRVEEDNVHIFGAAFDCKNGADLGKHACVYVRPHHFEVRRQRARKGDLPARVVTVNRAGPVVKLELVTGWGCPVNVEISTGRFRELGLKKDDEVFVEPKEIKVFPSVGEE